MLRVPSGVSIGACVLLAVQITLLAPGFGPRATPAGPAQVAIPELAVWEAQMVAVGRQMCDYFATAGLTLDQRLAHTYYDMTRVMLQIADYTGDGSWEDCARAARGVYRDEYVLPNGGGVPGYWNFTTGLRMDYERTISPGSMTAVALLAENAAYAADYTPLAWTESADLSREVAYAILGYLDAEALGSPPRARRAALIDQAYAHLEQWFENFAWRGTPSQFSPFMVALTAHSLIRDWEETADPRLIPALRRAADYLWTDAWVPDSEAMRYQLNPDSLEGGGRSPTGAPDLNLLIAPMYAFLYRQTGDTAYRDRGDQLFAGGVKGAWLGGGKQFDQNYWWSFDYVTWRAGQPDPLAVTLTSPTQGQKLSGTIAITASVPDRAAVTRIDYLVDGRVAASLAPPVLLYQWPTVGQAGHRRLTARVWDHSGVSATSSAVAITVLNSPPVASALAPTGSTAGSPGFTLTVRGADFLPNSVIRWNGAKRPTTFVGATELKAVIPSKALRKAGTVAISVLTPAPGGGASSALTFTVAARVDSIPAR